MTLSQKQQAFSVFAAKLILRAVEMGYGVALGEARRPPEMAEIYAKEGKGIAHSNHEIKLAIDLDLFKDGLYIGGSKEQIQPLGEWWEEQSTQDFVCCWGGRFTRVDADHFSFSNDGVK